MSTAHNDALADTQRWIANVVVGHNLCPFAARPLREKSIRYACSDAQSQDSLVIDLGNEISRLLADDNTETTLLIHPKVLLDFNEYNQFLSTADTVLAKLGVADKLQIASFHPQYRFADSPPDDPANYTNRSPWPMLHLLREASISRAVDNHGDPDSIPTRNVEYLRGLDHDEFVEQFVHQDSE